MAGNTILFVIMGICGVFMALPLDLKQCVKTAGRIVPLSATDLCAEPVTG